MTKGATIKEFVEFINSCVGLYPACDCHGPVLERIEIPEEPFLPVGGEYMDTCYECGVISSD